MNAHTSTTTPAHDAGTRRAALLGALEAYLSAVVAGDPAAVDLSGDFRETQNAVVSRPGTGIWQTARRVGTDVRLADPATGEAGFYGIIDEPTGPTLCGLRIKIDGDEVCEAEWIFARVGMTFYNPYGFRMNLPRREVPAGTRPARREAALDAARSYFDGIAAADGSIVKVGDEAYRVENGSLNVGRLPGEPPHTEDRPAGDGVTSALAPGVSGVTTRFENLRDLTADVIDRRFFYDETAGVVWTHGTFARVPGATKQDGSPLLWLNFFELFQIDADKISAVHAVMNYLPADVTDSGWLPPRA